MNFKEPNPKRWSITELPIKFKERRPFIHPEIHTFAELPENQKQILLNIKSEVEKEIGECTMSLFGSRKNGNWVDESDYDVIVYKDDINRETRDKLRFKNYGVKVDIFFSSKAPKENEVTF